MANRLGELLVRRGVLTAAQVDHIMSVQRHTARPFGELAEALFGVAPQDVEQAWAAQLAEITERFDPRRDRPEPAVHGLVNRRQAWQFGVLPVRMDADADAVVMATTEAMLPRAARFLAWRLAEPVHFIVATPADLERALHEHYPLPGARLAEQGSTAAAAADTASDRRDAASAPLTPVVRIVHPDR